MNRRYVPGPLMIERMQAIRKIAQPSSDGDSITAFNFKKAINFLLDEYEAVKGAYYGDFAAQDEHIGVLQSRIDRALTIAREHAHGGGGTRLLNFAMAMEEALTGDGQDVDRIDVWRHNYTEAITDVEPDDEGWWTKGFAVFDRPAQETDRQDLESVLLASGHINPEDVPALANTLRQAGRVKEPETES